MKVAAIIAEYNPLHKGHIYHINSTKEISGCDAVICIMSGNFVQRGEPAIIDKWMRTKMALKNGADLVIELPTVYSLASAEFFAFGAVSLLNNLGIIDYLSFGSEIGDVDILLKLASILCKEPDEYKRLLKYYLSEGNTFPSARSKALIQYLSTNNLLNKKGIDTILNSSNNILGIEYCKSLIKLNSNINIVTVKRQGAAYNENELDNYFSSATSIRNYLKENCDMEVLKNHLPLESYEILKQLHEINYKFTFPHFIFPYIKYKSLTCGDNLKAIPDVSEGLHNKIIKSLHETSSFDEVMQSIKSKRYTYTRISRILCQYFMGFEQFNISDMRKAEASYGRILGFNSKGKILLKALKKTSSIPLYTKLPRYPDEVLSLDLQATKAYSLINTSIKHNSDYITSPIILN